jgi:phospholipid/cholesterol/gamma-HCH transport system substrate-binding protein
MPDRSRLRWSQLKVGIVSLAAFIIVFVLVFLLTSTRGILQKNGLLRTYMDDASGIATGSVVRLNGIPVGYLDELRLTNSRIPNRTVEFDMQIQLQYFKDIPLDSVAAVAAANLLGDKFINITKGQSTQTVKPGDTLASAEVQDIPELMAQSANILKSFQTVVNRVDSLLAGVEAGKGNIGLFLKDEELYTRLTGIESEMQRLLNEIHTGNGTISKLIHSDELYQDVRAPLRRMDGILAGLQNGQGTAGKLLTDAALYEDIRTSLGEMRALVADLNAGKGTAGKLLKSDELSNRMNALLAHMDSTIDRLNSGQGTLGQLIVNPQLYTTLNSATREFSDLARDMRANPKKFLTIRLTLF